jgi:type IV pilus biogenesis protein CpaD/CtpE
MEIRIGLFLALVSFAVILNTVLIIFVYKAFAGMTSKVTQTVSEIQNNSEWRAWIQDFQSSAERAARVSEATKLKMAQFDEVLGRATESYSVTLSALDSQLERVAGKVDDTARTMRDAVAKPAVAVGAFVTGVGRALDQFQDEE